ncbi:hypothetical protein Glove_365g14 [Diversispora epigaea]|uniref:Endonuclease/exonuclease/phosphatase domain-containing protein n=1 Tax=Diversispora epigaea TaxID=1348612 RepID=A0A397HFA1_9GLOM|nr:hypothetical protein Glove_365g14 [Diversispora epigaea]
MEEDKEIKEFREIKETRKTEEMKEMGETEELEESKESEEERMEEDKEIKEFREIKETRKTEEMKEMGETEELEESKESEDSDSSTNNNSNSNNINKKSEKITETENIEIQYDKKTIKWKIATQNIKSLNDKTKQSIFWNQSRKEYLINEPKEYQTWFSSMEENIKKLGHGVAITLKKNIALYTFKKKELKGYALQLLLSFKGKYIVQLITIYNPPQTTENASIRLKLKNWLIENLNEGKSKNWHTIIGGDWNTTLHPEFDRKTTHETTNASTNKRKPRSSILNHVKYMDFIDAYEITNNNKEKTEEKNLTLYSNVPNRCLLGRQRNPSEWTDKKYILWEEIMGYQKHRTNLMEKIPRRNRKQTANNNITKAKIPKNKTTKNNYHRLAIIQTINRLNRTIRKTKREINDKIDNNNKNNSKKIEKIKENINKNIKIIKEKLNGKKMEKIEEIKKTEIIEEWIKNAKEIGKIWREEAKKEINEKTTKQIKEHIKRRQLNLKDNPKTMIDSILGRWKKQIITDRITRNNTNNQQIK